MKKADYLIWMDLEMTGLNPEEHVIIEMGSMVTDSDLNVIAEGPCLVIHQPKRALDRMDSWCVRQHGGSGLTQKVKDSKISLKEAERETLKFLKRYCLSGKSPLCGNSIGQDRRFLVRYMPTLNDFFHYRNLDVSTLKELVRRWYPTLEAPAKMKTHHVMDDIRESVAELKHYRQTVFR